MTAKTTSNEFTVTGAEYTNDVDRWTLGERPEVEVTLKAAEGFRFSYTSSSHFRLSGCGADFVRAKIYDDGDTMILKAYLKRAEGKPEEVYGLEWSGTWAMWEASEEDIKSYEVRLYRNKRLVTTVTTTDTEYDFRSHITQNGDYTFRVRAVARYEDRTGPHGRSTQKKTPFPITKPNITGRVAGSKTSMAGGTGIITGIIRRAAGRTSTMHGIILTATAIC